MSLMINIVSGALILVGLTFFLAATVGIVRFPDFYTRMHAAGKGDTLSTILILLGVALYTVGDFSVETLLVAIKIMAIAVFIMVTSPTSTHALMQAGYDDGIKPFEKKKEDKKDSEGQPEA
jgi:multicomponent Na+:H+ antiporter subunit G